MICLYIILALSLNFIVGYGGLLSIAHAAFYGIGAYIYALLVLQNVPWLISLIFAVLGASLCAYLIAYPTLKLKGDYFILATIGFQIISFGILYNLIPITRGPYGIAGIPRVSLFGIQLTSIPANFLLFGIFAIGIIFFSWAVYNSPFGRILKSIRENEIATQAFGKNTGGVKIWAFVLASGIAAIAGGLYASYVTYIDPTSFTLDESIFILAIVLVGGSGNLKGPIIGAIFLVVLPEILRFIGISSSYAPNLRQIIYALILIIFVFRRPQGILGEYKLE